MSGDLLADLSAALNQQLLGQTEAVREFATTLALSLQGRCCVVWF